MLERRKVAGERTRALFRVEERDYGPWLVRVKRPPSGVWYDRVNRKYHQGTKRITKAQAMRILRPPIDIPMEPVESRYLQAGRATIATMIAGLFGLGSAIAAGAIADAKGASQGETIAIATVAGLGVGGGLAYGLRRAN